jgi:GxxExxY protein
MELNEISGIILNAAIEVHKTLGGPGLLESVYEEALVYELIEHRLNVQRQMTVPIIYKGKTLGDNLRLDILVEKQIVIECKAVEKYNKIFEAQTLTYLRLLNLRLGLVINFGSPTIKEGFHRVINGY